MVATAPRTTTSTAISTRPTRSSLATSLISLRALMLRDLVVLKKNFAEFVIRTLVQPFLLCFVFLFVFPKIGQAVGGTGGGSASESAFATVLVPGVVGISIMFQGVQSVALQMAQEVLSGAIQGIISAIIVLPIASVVHAARVNAMISEHWLLVLTLVPLACITMASLGLLLGTSFEPRNIGLMFGFVVLPITFLGGTYYPWTRLAAVKIGGWHWLQTVVLVNPLIYVNEGMRAAFTDAPHIHLYIIYPVLIGFTALFLSIGLRNFNRRVLS
jgi:ABC-2 type transport system permease protein